jgi:hypothetical protein
VTGGKSAFIVIMPMPFANLTAPTNFTGLPDFRVITGYNALYLITRLQERLLPLIDSELPAP